MQPASGADTPVEQCSADELLQVGGQTATTPLPAFSPVFDVTPTSLVDVTVAEPSVVEQPDATKMRRLMQTGVLH